VPVDKPPRISDVPAKEVRLEVLPPLLAQPAPPVAPTDGSPIHALSALILVAVDSLWAVFDWVPPVWIVAIPACFAAVFVPTYLIQRHLKNDSKGRALTFATILAVLAAVIICGLLGLRGSSRLAGVTISIVMLVRTGSHWTLALHRVMEVFLGILVALAISTLVFPDRARLRLREGLAQEFLELGSFFVAILEGFRGAPADNMPALRKDVLERLSNNNQLLEAARNEPSGDPGWREGLSMLSQFGRALFDALIALELAVKDSNEDGYAQQLEPALERLAVDIRAGFHYVAECIHGWRFHIPPPGLLLEEDIAQLEARMAEVRPTGYQFSQAEILRAYAVQLHLKQIARLLRASRVETRRAIGEARG